MMNALHLLWIVPLCIFAGYAVCCILTIGRQADERMDEIMRGEQTQWVSILERYPTKEDADKNGEVIVYGIRHDDHSVTEVYFADWDDTSVYPYVSTHWIRTPKILNAKQAFPQVYEKLNEIFPTKNVTVEASEEPLTGTVTITGTDIDGNEATETIPVPGQSKGVYVSLLGEGGAEHE